MKVNEKSGSSDAGVASSTSAIGRHERGQTRPSRSDDDDDGATPRLPHERDESADDQASMETSQNEVASQAADDLRAGKQGTDRSAETDGAYNANFKRPGGPPKP